MTKSVTNFAASARARLLTFTKQRKGEFQFTLQRYAAERFLYRLGMSPHRARFVLKGAMLFVLWDESRYRPTKDLDLAGYWANDAASLQAAFRDICSVPYPHDGLEFDLDSMAIAPIRNASEYHGFRITLDVHLESAVIPFQIDVGFGDVIVPDPVEVVYPVLLDAEPPRIRAYPREASISEKLHAMVSLADANSRFKDFFDIYVLSSRFAFAGESLAAAITATFSNRSATRFNTWPVAFTPAFYADEPRSNQWRRFLTRLKLTDAPTDFGVVGERIIAFLAPPSRAVADRGVFLSSWLPGGPWR